MKKCRLRHPSRNTRAGPPEYQPGEESIRQAMGLIERQALLSLPFSLGLSPIKAFQALESWQSFLILPI